MDASKLQVKVFVAGSGPVALEPLIPVFHGWIRTGALGELMVDVANYAHVPKGPGVGLVGHGSDYFLDAADGRPGLLYTRKREAPAPGERLADVFRRALRACELLEAEPSLGGKLRFRTDELLFRVNDRLAAPNGEATFAALRPDLDAFCARLFAGAPFQLAMAAKPKQLFAIRISSDGKASLATLLGRLGRT